VTQYLLDRIWRSSFILIAPTSPTSAWIQRGTGWGSTRRWWSDQDGITWTNIDEVRLQVIGVKGFLSITPRAIR